MCILVSRIMQHLEYDNITYVLDPQFYYQIQALCTSEGTGNKLQTDADIFDFSKAFDIL